jgi:hypothetical protein
MEIIHQDNNETVYQFHCNGLETWISLVELTEQHSNKTIKTLTLGTTLFVSVSSS